jgi:hypothetical protein
MSLLNKFMLILFFHTVIVRNLSIDLSFSVITNSNDLNIIAKCKEICSIRFFNATEERTPPILYSFPGSGNTWARLLIDLATGIYSGSPYDDPFLISTFPGEGICNKSVSVVKMHPTINAFVNIHHIKGRHQPRCPTLLFEQAILLIRDPYDAIFAEFVRTSVDSHVASLPKQNFNHRKWIDFASTFTHDYFQMFHTHYRQLQHIFKDNNYIYIRYEDLRNTTMQADLLRKIVSFLKFDIVEDRITCAMQLSDNTNVHRIKSSNDLTKDDVYSDENVVCDMWSIFGYYARDFGYSPRGFTCNSTVLDTNNIAMKMTKLRLTMSKPSQTFGFS